MTEAPRHPRSFLISTSEVTCHMDPLHPPPLSAKEDKAFSIIRPFRKVPLPGTILSFLLLLAHCTIPFLYKPSILYNSSSLFLLDGMLSDYDSISQLDLQVYSIEFLKKVYFMCVRESKGGTEREGEREKPKHTPHCQHRA